MRSKPRTHHAVAELAERQHGVVSTHQLRELGYSKSAISYAHTTGRVHQVHRGVYAIGHAGLTRQGRCLAAVLACGDNALLSHRSAAWLHGLTSRWHQVVDVTAATPLESQSMVRMHSAKTLQAEDRSSSEGIPVMAVPRTLLDFAAVDPYFLGRALDRAERLGLLDVGELDSHIARSRGYRGVARLRQALEIHRTPAFTRSGLERRFLKLVHDAGLPKPLVNLFIEGYELDAYWPAERFAVELDTYDYHGGHLAFEADRIRQEDLKLAGIEITRITGTRIAREPRTVTKRLHRLLTQRRHELARTASG